MTEISDCREASLASQRHTPNVYKKRQQLKKKKGKIHTHMVNVLQQSHSHTDTS